MYINHINAENKIKNHFGVELICKQNSSGWCSTIGARAYAYAAIAC